MEKDALPCLNFLTKKAPYKGLCADSVEKHEPASHADAAVVDSLKALDPNRPIREADSFDLSVRELGPGSAAQFSPRGVIIAIYAVLTVSSK
jgi:hypothetical protein